MAIILGFVLILADDAQHEWTRFAGTWQRVSHEADGRKTPAERAKRFQLLLRVEGTYTVQVDNQIVTEGTARLDPTRKPKTIEMTPTSGPSKGKPMLGIYELEGDEYRICYAPADKPRPSAFSAPSGSGHVLIVYRRAKK